MIIIIIIIIIIYSKAYTFVLITETHINTVLCNNSNFLTITV